MKKYIPLLLSILSFICFQAYGGDLVDGLEEGSSFIRRTIVPLLSIIGFIIAGITFVFGEGPEAKKKSYYIIVGSILVFASSWIVTKLQSFFGG